MPDGAGHCNARRQHDDLLRTMVSKSLDRRPRSAQPTFVEHTSSCSHSKLAMVYQLYVGHRDKSTPKIGLLLCPRNRYHRCFDIYICQTVWSVRCGFIIADL